MQFVGLGQAIGRSTGALSRKRFKKEKKKKFTSKCQGSYETSKGDRNPTKGIRYPSSLRATPFPPTSHFSSPIFSVLLTHTRFADSDLALTSTDPLHVSLSFKLSVTAISFIPLASTRSRRHHVHTRPRPPSSHSPMVSHAL